MRNTKIRMGIILSAIAGPALADGMAGMDLGRTLYNQPLAPALLTQAQDSHRGTSFRLYGGVAMSNRLSLHGGLMSLGNPDESQTSGFDTTNGHVSVRGAFGEIRWQWRPGQAWRPYLKAGLAVLTAEAEFTSTDSSSNTTTTHDSRASTVLAPGAGLVYETLDHWGIDIHAERYLHTRMPLGAPAQDIDNVSAGVYTYW